MSQNEIKREVLEYFGVGLDDKVNQRLSLDLTKKFGTYLENVNYDQKTVVDAIWQSLKKTSITDEKYANQVLKNLKKNYPDVPELGKLSLAEKIGRL